MAQSINDRLGPNGLFSLPALAVDGSNVETLLSRDGTTLLTFDTNNKLVANIVGGTINNATIGATTPTTAVVTTLKTSGYTVATLPAGTTGMRAYVTDATTPTYNAALVGGGAVVVPVFYNGTAWVSA